MKGFRVPILLLLGAVLSFGATTQAQEPQQEPLDVSPMAPDTCPYDVPTWAERALPVEELMVGSTLYTAAELNDFLNVGLPDDRLSLPLVVHLAQEWLAFRLNLAVGFTPTVESSLAASQFEFMAARDFGGLPPVDGQDLSSSDSDVGLEYINSVLVAYNLCEGPAF